MESGLKRKSEEREAGPSKKTKMEDCPHGLKCYRKNPHHFREFEHPHLLELMKMSEVKIPEDYPQEKTVYLEQLSVLRPLMKFQPAASAPSTAASAAPPEKALTMVEKLKKAAPYNVFFTTIPKSPETLTQANSVTFTDLLCPSLGNLRASLQINFMIDIMWLMEQYKARSLETKPLTILYGDDWPDMKEYIDKFLPNVTHHLVKMKDPYGCHHSKIGIYQYDDHSLRVVVSTANLYYEDWNHYNQGLWISPACRPLIPNSYHSGESPTLFKTALLSYLKHYELPEVHPWIEAVKNADFSDVKVVLVTSVPGKHYPESSSCHIHYVGRLLSRYCTLPTKSRSESEGPLDWGVIAQASSIGSLGKSPGEWLRRTLLRSLSGHKATQLTSNSNATLSVVFPSIENVKNCYLGAQGAGCLPYSKETNEKQKWLHKYLHHWKADRLNRTKAIPHIKTYCRVSPCLTKLAWFLLTSANISKSAWGGNIQRDRGVYVRSCEAGVMFLPKFFEEEYFEIEKTSNSKNKKTFPFIYDLPLTEYKSSDYPWCN